MRATRFLFAALLVACTVTENPRDTGGSVEDVRTPRDVPAQDIGPLPDLPPRDAPRDDAGACETPLVPAGPEVAIAPEFAGLYAAYTLGPVPGVPNPLGGIVVSADDPNTLIVVGASERTEGALYEIGVRRDVCGHIIEFRGTARRIASTPFADANLVYGPDRLLIYTEWPQYHISQLSPGAMTPTRRTDLVPLGIDNFLDSGPGGIGFVPPGLVGAGSLRIVTWPAGHWYRVGATLSGGLYTIDSLTETARVPNGPGGFAYVPAGSPGFDVQSLIVAEWQEFDHSLDRVAVYQVNAEGDPITSTRREFLSRFPKPWGAYFEPVTGDYLFLTWGDGDDRVYIVQGFLPPPILF